MNGFLKLIENQCLLNKDKICISTGNEIVTYNDLYFRTISFANYLINEKNSPKQIYLRAKENIFYWTAYLGSILSGAVVIPIDKSLPLNALNDLFSDKKEEILFISDEKEEQYDSINYENVEIESLKNHMSPLKSFKDFEAGHLTQIVFTTGSTGKSKGTCWSYSCFKAFGVAHDAMVFNKDTVILMVSALTHSFTFGPFYDTLFNGGTYIYVDGLKDIDGLFEKYKKFKANSIAILPSAMNYLITTSKNKLDEIIPDIKFIDLSGEKLTKKTQEDLIRLLPNARLFNAYGSTETTILGVYEFSRYGASDNRVKSIEFANLFPSLTFFDDDFNEIKPTKEHPGLIGAKLTFEYLGYYNDNANVDPSFKHGYFVLSDLGYVDDDGFVCLIGRNNDVITSGGYKINPTEIEEVALDSNMINECICYGLPNDIFGKLVAINVIPNEKYVKKEFGQYLMSHLEKYKMPRYINEVDEIKKNQFGKIDRKYYKNLNK